VGADALTPVGRASTRPRSSSLPRIGNADNACPVASPCPPDEAGAPPNSCCSRGGIAGVRGSLVGADAPTPVGHACPHPHPHLVAAANREPGQRVSRREAVSPDEAGAPPNSCCSRGGIAGVRGSLVAAAASTPVGRACPRPRPCPLPPPGIEDERMCASRARVTRPGWRAPPEQLLFEGGSRASDAHSWVRTRRRRVVTHARTRPRSSSLPRIGNEDNACARREPASPDQAGAPPLNGCCSRGGFRASEGHSWLRTRRRDCRTRDSSRFPSCISIRIPRGSSVTRFHSV